MTIKLFRKIMITSIIVILLLLNINTPAQAVENNEENRIFPDIPVGHWSEVFAKYMVDKGYLDTNEEGLFEPDRPATRAEVVDLVIKQTGLEIITPDTPTFSDISTGSSVFSAIETAVARQIVSGFDDNTFRAEDPVTRAQFLKIIFNANDQTMPDLIPNASFSDVAHDHWAAAYIYFALNNNLVKGFADGVFRPDNKVTRAESAKILYLLLAGKGLIEGELAIMSDEQTPAIDKKILLYEDFILSIINISRAELLDKAPLVLNPELSRTARLHAQYLVDNNLKSEHEGNDGSSPFDRIKNAGIDYLSAGENIGWASANTRSIADTLMAIHKEMMSLPDNRINHRTNIMGNFQEFNKIGIGVVISDNKGSREVRIVQNFIETK